MHLAAENAVFYKRPATLRSEHHTGPDLDVVSVLTLFIQAQKPMIKMPVIFAGANKIGLLPVTASQ